jgi:hypothetical protein
MRCKLVQACQVLLDGKTSLTSINVVVTGTPPVVIDDYTIGDHAASGISAISGPRSRLHSQLIDPRSTWISSRIRPGCCTRSAEDLGRGSGVLNEDGEVGMELAGRRAMVTGTNRGLRDQFVEGCRHECCSCSCQQPKHRCARTRRGTARSARNAGIARCHGPRRHPGGSAASRCCRPARVGHRRTIRPTRGVNRLRLVPVSPCGQFVRTAGSGSGTPATVAMILATRVRSDLKDT